MTRILILLAALALPMGLSATPTRALTLDNQQELVADDYDATVYYSLAPNFRDHFYLDALNGGQVRGWTFLDIKYGTLVLWWNREYSPASLFNILGSQFTLGYSLADLNTGLLGAPSEGLVKAPDMKIALGYGLDTSITGLNLGLCFQYAQLDQKLHADATNGSGGPVNPLPSSARYLNGTYYSDLTVTGYANRQSSSGMTVAPLVSYSGESFALDLKAELIWNHIDNSHQETDMDNGGSMAGTVTQGLKDTGGLSKGGKARLRVPMGDSSVVLKGSYYDFDLSTEHSQLGTFSGSGFSAAQLAGFNHVDATESLTQRTWDGMLGWVHAFDGGRNLLVLGLGAYGNSLQISDQQKSPRIGGSGFNDLITTLRHSQSDESVAVPLLIGTEAELTHAIRARAVLQRNFWGSSSSSSLRQAYDAGSGALQRQDSGGVDSDLNSQWTFATGLGLDLGSLRWDTALNTGFLASSAGWVNPAYQSTVSWSF